jgi:TonB family protein
MRNIALLIVALLGSVSAQVVLRTPARLASGSAPALPALAVGGGQVFVELSVSPAGEVTAADPLRTTPGFTAAVVTAIRAWRFRAATAASLKDDGLAESRTPVSSKVLVAALFRAPTLVSPTLGEASQDAGTPSAEMPFPRATVEPPYPPRAGSPGVVVVEVMVSETGTVDTATIVTSAPPFDAAALDAASRWRFRPARSSGHAVAAYAYLVFGFPEPVGPPARR